MIKFENVSIKYIPDFYCLYNFNKTISGNTLFVGDDFLGAPSVLRLIAKLDKQYDGNIFIDDVNIKSIKDKDLCISYLPKSPTLFENKNAFKNWYYPLKIRKIGKKQAKNIIESAFLGYNLKNLKNFKHCSESTKKIYALVRAVIRKPKYILLENFFEDLESEHTELATKILKEISTSTTIIACEKDIENLKYFQDFEVVSFYEF